MTFDLEAGVGQGERVPVEFSGVRHRRSGRAPGGAEVGAGATCGTYGMQVPVDRYDLPLRCSG